MKELITTTVSHLRVILKSNPFYDWWCSDECLEYLNELNPDQIVTCFGDAYQYKSSTKYWPTNYNIKKIIVIAE